MTTYVKSFLGNIPANMEGLTNTLAASYLLQINNQSPVPLAVDIRELFHTLVEKLSYLGKCRPDIMVAISFLCTRLKTPDVDDYRKLN
jgi:hypothetical protein